MQRIFLIMALVAVCLCNQAFAAATVFFKDGSKEVGTSAWSEGNSIYLNKTNEVYEFPFDEVEMEETLKFNRIGKYADKIIPDSSTKDHQKTVVNQEKASQNKKYKMKPTANAAMETVRVTEATAPLPKDTLWWAPGDTPADFLPGTPTLLSELSAVYAKYNQATSSGDFNQVVRYMPQYQAQRSLELLEKVSDKKEKLQRKKNLQEMAVKDFSAQKCAVSPDGTIAALAGRGKTMKGSTYQYANGTIKFEKENDSWKVSFQIW